MIAGDDAGWLLDSPTRLRIDLAGDWFYHVSGGSKGNVTLPSAYDFAGEVTFERKFEINPNDIKKYQFHVVVLGANYTCNISINTDFIVNHIGGYTSFTAPIPDHVLQPGKENIIRVVTDNRLDAMRTIPLRHRVWGWRNYGGVFRHIYILGTPRIFIANVAAMSEISPDYTVARVRLQVSVDGAAPGDTADRRYQLLTEVYEKISGTLVASSAPVPLVRQGNEWSSTKLECAISAPRLWSPSTADLYSVRTYIVDAAAKTRIDERRVNVGIRTVQITNGKLTLNGKPLVLWGVNWYEDHVHYGSALSYGQMEKDLIAIKNLGANAIRFGHHPPHPFMLNLCDRYGLLALVELPVKDVPALALEDEQFLDLASSMLREMIVRDRNHPAVFAWGLGDDFESSSPPARRFVASLAATARKLDTRPLYYGTSLLSDDLCRDLVDFTALTLSIRDVRAFRKTLEDMKAASPQRLLVLGKVGVEVQPDNSNGYTDPLSLQAQARFYYQHIDAARLAGVDGFFVWSFNDWKGDRPALTVNSGDPWVHTMGLVSTSREKRTAYEAVRVAFEGGRFSALQPGKSSASSPIVYVVSGLVLLIGTAYQYNASRRFRESLNRSLINTYNFFSDVRDQRIVTVAHSSLVGLLASAAIAIVLSSLLYRFRHSIMLDNLLSYILISDNVKETAVRLILQPHMFILVCTGALFFPLVFTSIVVWIVARLLKTRIYPFHTYAVTMWSTPPLLILLPVGMIVYRLMDDPMYVAPTVLLSILLLVWVFFRFLKGLAIVTDVYPVKVYALGILSVLGMLTGVYLYFDYTQSASVYVSLLYNDIISRIR